MNTTGTRMFAFLVCATCVISFVTGTSVNAASTAWPTFRHDAQHTGRSSATGPSVPLQKWRLVVDSVEMSSPTVGADGTIYILSATGRLYAISATGSKKWEYTARKWDFYSGFFIPSSPAIGADGTIYVGSGDYCLHAVNSNGTAKWAFETGDYISSSPVVGADGTIYVGSADDYLYAVNPNGTQKWAFETGDNVESSPAIGLDGTIYVGSSDSKLYAINPTTGSKKWAFTTEGVVMSSPAVGSDGTIYVGSSDNNLYAIGTSGTEKWSFHLAGDVNTASPAIAPDGTIYIGSSDTVMYALNANGVQKWGFYTDSGLCSTAASIGADGTLYIAAYDSLYAVSSDSGQKFRFDFPSGDYPTGSPAIGPDGTVYVGTWDGAVCAVGTPTVTSVKLTASPTSPRTVGTTITLTATPTGDSAMQYKFLAGTTVLRNYASEKTMTWKPTVAQTHKLTVVAKDSRETTVTSPVLSYVITPSVKLSASPASPRLAGTSITLTVTTLGATNLQYKFLAGSTVLRDFASASTFNWVPFTPGAYQLTVVGKTSAGTTYTSSAVSYTVNPTVTLAANPASKQIVGIPVTLTATALNPTGLVYKFLANGSIIRDFAASKTFTKTFTTAKSYSLIVITKDTAGKLATSPALSYVITPSVKLTASPTSPRTVGTTITLTATPTGDSDMQYKFLAGTTVLRNYASEKTMTWKPTVAQTYKLTVVAKDSRETTVTSPALSYVITPSVKLSASPTSPRTVGTTITLTATPTGDSAMQYKFLAGTTVLRNYASEKTMTWKPTVAQTHKLTVVAKDSRETTVTSPVLSYAITPSVRLSASPASPRLAGTSITLTATTLGATNLQYKFLAGTTVLRDFASASTFNWVPFTPGAYQLTVVGKTSAGTTHTSSAVSYTVNPTVTLAANPASKQIVGLPVTLTATALNPTGLVYKFLANGSIIRDFAASKTFTKTFTTAKSYSLIVITKNTAGKLATSPAVVYQVVPAVTSVNLSANPVSPRISGTSVTLTATAVGGLGVKYKFLSGQTVLRDFASAKTLTWTQKKGSYQLTVVAKDASGKTVTSPVLTYTFNPAPPISSVTLAANPVRSQVIGQNLTLTATAVGGEGVLYKFLSGTTILRDFGTSNTLTRSFTTARTYQLTVVAKDSTGKTVTSPVLSYIIYDPNMRPQAGVWASDASIGGHNLLRFNVAPSGTYLTGIGSTLPYGCSAIVLFTNVGVECYYYNSITISDDGTFSISDREGYVLGRFTSPTACSGSITLYGNYGTNHVINWTASPN